MPIPTPDLTRFLHVACLTALTALRDPDADLKAIAAALRDKADHVVVELTDAEEVR